MDASTISAVVALIVSTFALVVALAQALQQYFITGQLIRLCDSVVYGPMEGQGRRVWQWSQFRFRVLYTLPLVSLDKNLWPAMPPHVKSYAVGAERFPMLDEPPPGMGFRQWPGVRDSRPSISTGPYSSSGNVSQSDCESCVRRRRGNGDHDGDSSSSTTTDTNTNSSDTQPAQAWVARVWNQCRAWVVRQIQTIGRLGRLDRKRRRRWRRKVMDCMYHWTTQIWWRSRMLLHKTKACSGSGHDSSRPVVDEPDPKFVGEAAWMSFCRAVQPHCGCSMRIDLSEHDADRCPTDLTTVPMPVSMRDIVIMGLATGMEVTDCSFQGKSVSMQGQIGTITTAHHPVLGSLLHFTSRRVQMQRVSAFGVYRHVIGGSPITSRWICRTWDVCIIAGTYYHSGNRRKARRLDRRWLQDANGKKTAPDIVKVDDSKDKKKGRKKAKGVDHGSGGKKPEAGQAKEKEKESTSKQDPHKEGWSPERRPQDGYWTLWEYANDLPHQLQPIGLGMVRVVPKPQATPRPPLPIMAPSRIRSQHVATVEDISDNEDDNTYEKPVLGESSQMPTSMPIPIATDIQHQDKGGDDGDGDEDNRAKTALARQEERRERTKAIQKDKEIVQESVRKGIMPSPYQNTMPTPHRSKQLLLTYPTQNPGHPESMGADTPPPTKEETEAHERERQRHRERQQREKERHQRWKTGNQVALLTRMDMFWFCQMDIFQGFWATPWAKAEHMPIQSSLTGAIIVLLECLLGFLPGNALSYIDFRHVSFQSFQQTTLNWLCLGKSTYPAYALNARGGVIATGVYRMVRVPAFDGLEGNEMQSGKKDYSKGDSASSTQSKDRRKDTDTERADKTTRTHGTPIMALELLYSYEWQVQQEVRDRSRYGEELNVELMRMDSWLSFVGRLPAIADGPNQLLDNTPSLVDILRDQFWLDFQYMDLNASNGGRQAIQSLAGSVLDWMVGEGLTEAEQLYLTVACLRGFKVGQSILAGADTLALRDILLKDVQVHLV